MGKRPTKIIQSILVTRTAPDIVKWLTRNPIGKPIPGETRLLSLINVRYSFLLGAITYSFVQEINIPNLLPKGIRERKTGQGIDQIMLFDMAVT